MSSFFMIVKTILITSEITNLKFWKTELQWNSILTFRQCYIGLLWLLLPDLLPTVKYEQVRLGLDYFKIHQKLQAKTTFVNQLQY